MKIDAAVTAVITGGASGLGEATARRLASAGAKIALFDLNEERGEALAKEIGGVFCKADITSEAQVDSAFSKARSALGQERILVNCAGTGKSIKTVTRDKDTGQIHPLPTSAFDSTIQINLIGTFRCIAKSAAGMLSLDPFEDGERGVIINTASIAAQDGQMGQAAYAASKAAIVGMTLPIARDLMNEGVRVNTIMPGIFATPLMNVAPEKVLAALASSVPFPKRLGKPDEFASLVLEVCENVYFNGESIRLDGALRMGAR